MFCRKDLFEFCGGFPEDFFAGEEIELAKKMKTKCKDLGWSYKIMTHDYVISSARKLGMVQRLGSFKNVVTSRSFNQIFAKSVTLCFLVSTTIKMFAQFKSLVGKS